MFTRLATNRAPSLTRRAMSSASDSSSSVLPIVAVGAGGAGVIAWWNGLFNSHEGTHAKGQESKAAHEGMLSSGRAAAQAERGMATHAQLQRRMTVRGGGGGGVMSGGGVFMFDEDEDIDRGSVENCFFCAACTALVGSLHPSTQLIVKNCCDNSYSSHLLTPSDPQKTHK